jgi:membrane associated rhomboid family serine protease
MVKYNFSYDSNVILDRCDECEGIWVDGPEVRRLAIYLKGNPRLDRLAESLMDHEKETREFREMCEQWAHLGQRGTRLLIVLPKVVLPLRDDAERLTLPIFTGLLILTNVVVSFLAFSSTADIQAVFHQFGFIPKRIVDGYAYLTFLTYMFLHVGVLHLLGNMLFLWIFGDNIEDAFGRIGYTLVYFASGVAAAGFHLALYPDSTTPCIGASGAVAGVMGAYFVLYPKARIDTFVMAVVIKIPAYLYIGIWFLMQILLAWLTGSAAQVGYTAHVGGLVAGAALAGGLRVFRATKGHPPAP